MGWTITAPSGVEFSGESSSSSWIRKE